MMKSTFAVLLMLIASPATMPTTHRSVATTTAAPAATAPNLEIAQGRYNRTVRDAHAQYLRDLNELLKRAFRAGNLEQANELTELIKAAEAQRLELPARSIGKPTTIEVPANADWQQGVSVRKGDLVHISASGQWCVDTRQRDIATCGPDAITPAGTLNHVPQFSQLMARLGNRFYVVGKETVIRAEDDGTVQLRINDMIIDDNDGAVQVTMVRQSQ